ncbi:ArsR/SmtB family transcription factor [Sulfobacillus harzensis]|uniref:ArsR/SmtB family transcription factor n=1 Tax=Sulfobacillus harzensis TaxID=2729629 RepID=UPI001A9B2B36|nr:metalloregulator ArsR/SmtB family transcription factor [Sulfobacillus harzensis]
MFADWAERFRVLGDATRLRILSLLTVRDACVCELVELLPVSQPAVSQHLRRLKETGLVTEYRQKAWTYYRLRTDVPPALAACLAALPVDAEDAAWLHRHHVGLSCAVMDPSSPALGAADLVPTKEEMSWKRK